MSSASTREASPAPGSSTQIVTNPPSSRLRAPFLTGTLVLRGEPDERRRIRWAEDVADNEGMGKKSSKVCCIYHKSRAVGESSSDESSDSSSSDESDNEADNGEARMVGGGRATGKREKGRGHRPHHDHDDEGPGGGHGGHDDGSRKGKAPRAPRKKSPNAYERMPKTGGS